MATREITKQEPRFVDPDLEQEILVEQEEASNRRQRLIGRLTLLWRERRFLFRCAGAGLALSMVIVMLMPVQYTSTTRLMPPDQAGAGVASMLAAVSKAGGELGSIGEAMLGGVKTSGDLFIGVLHSRTVQDDLIDKFDLRKEYGVRRYEDARTRLTNSTDVSAERKSGIITIKVTDHNRARAAAMAREYVAALNNVVITLNTSSAHKERVFLEERLAQVQKDLETSEKDFSTFASQNTALDVKEQGRAMIGAAADLQGQLIAAETQLQGLQQIYTPENVRIRSLRARIDEYRRQLKKMGGKPGGSNDDGSASEENANADSSDLYPSIRQLPILGVRWADLYRDTKVEEAVYEALTKQYELAKVEEARETPSVKVLDPADEPERKSFPPRTILVALTVMLVFVGGCVWVLGCGRWHEIDPADPGKMLVQEVVGSTRQKVKQVFEEVRRRSTRNGKRSSP